MRSYSGNGLCLLLALMLVPEMMTIVKGRQNYTGFVDGRNDGGGDDEATGNFGWGFLQNLWEFLFPCGLFPADRCGFLNLGVAMQNIEPGTEECTEICKLFPGFSFPDFQCGFCPVAPTGKPSLSPSKLPSIRPSDVPMVAPTGLTPVPSESPTKFPSISPTLLRPPEAPISVSPTVSRFPTSIPTGKLSSVPSTLPSTKYTSFPSLTPTQVPTHSPTTPPSSSPSLAPTDMPTVSPTEFPSATPTLPPSTLVSGDRLYADREPYYIRSPNGEYRFGFSPPDSDLALWTQDENGDFVVKLWSAFVSNINPIDLRLSMQSDGNLVLRDATGNAIWNSISFRNPGASLHLGDDGKARLIFVREDGLMEIPWQTFACGALSGPRDDETPLVSDLVDATTVHRKIMAGYQGWFDTKCSDRGQWTHWSNDQTPNSNTYEFDMWPDLSEFGADELCPTDFQYEDGSAAGLFSSINPATVDRHFQWMWEYGIDGVYLQRFIVSDWCFDSAVLDNVRRGAEKYGRTFAYMFDISNSDEATLYDEMKAEWTHLVDVQEITKSSRYLHHNGLPVLAIWGLGFRDRPGMPDKAAELFDWFKNNEDERYRVTLMGGVDPIRWRTDANWYDAYRLFDIISPWSVGRYQDNAGADYYRNTYMEPDVEECDAFGIDYLPVVWPGFSWSYRTITEPDGDYPFNEIPRRGGEFFWRQIHNAVSAFPDKTKAQVYVAMFDEVDESTAVFKVPASEAEVPGGANFLTLNADPGYAPVPNDWYLNLMGTATSMLRSDGNVPSTMPTPPPLD